MWKKWKQERKLQVFRKEMLAVTKNENLLSLEDAIALATKNDPLPPKEEAPEAEEEEDLFGEEEDIPDVIVPEDWRCDIKSMIADMVARDRIITFRAISLVSRNGYDWFRDYYTDDLQLCKINKNEESDNPMSKKNQQSTPKLPAMHSMKEAEAACTEFKEMANKEEDTMDDGQEVIDEITEVTERGFEESASTSEASITGPTLVKVPAGKVWQGTKAKLKVNPKPLIRWTAITAGVVAVVLGLLFVFNVTSSFLDMVSRQGNAINALEAQVASQAELIQSLSVGVDMSVVEELQNVNYDLQQEIADLWARELELQHVIMGMQIEMNYLYEDVRAIEEVIIHGEPNSPASSSIIYQVPVTQLSEREWRVGADNISLPKFMGNVTKVDMSSTITNSTWTTGKTSVVFTNDSNVSFEVEIVRGLIYQVTQL